VIRWQGPASRLVLLAGCAATLAAACSNVRRAALDRSFGGRGYAAMALGSWVSATAVRVQPDGKIVSAGEAQLANGEKVMVSTRTEPDGSVDRSYGTGGVVTVDVGGAAGANALALQPDGKIVLAGEGRTGAMVFAAARLLPNGALDRTFGSGGIATVPVGPVAMANAVQVQPDGKIALAGTTLLAHNQFAAARLNADGSLDKSFGSGGTTALPPTGAAWAMALQRDGKLVLVGQQDDAGREVYMAARLLANGAPDRNFGRGGIVSVPVGKRAYGDAVALQPDGQILLAGSAYTSTSVAATVRLTAQGSVDRTFGHGGIATIPDWYGVNAATIQPADGKIVLAGTGASIVRLNPDGSADATLGGGGVRVLRLGGSDDAANGVAVQPHDGRIVLAGTANISGRLQLTLLRLTP
jgi:uncharacterized delta-60 repeat protein